jgi:hypothetical protein
MVAHALSPRVPSPARLRSLVAALHGRLAVLNPSNAARLPTGLVSAVQGLVRVGFDGEVLLATDARDSLGLDPRPRGQSSVHRGTDVRATYERLRVGALLNALPSSTRERLADAVHWAVVALYESTTPILRFTTSFGSDASNDSPTVVAVAEIGYRVVITAGTTVPDRASPDDREAMDRNAIAAAAAAWPPRGHPGRGAGHEQPGGASRPWFVTRLLVPDTWLSTHADHETLAHWARLTGRSGETDRYWFPETWDRFLEPGRRVGWLTANDVWRRRRGRLPSAAIPAREEATFDDVPHDRWRGMTLTPDLERGVGVPPGYALVQCVGTLEVSVVVRP